ncbi:hypothetical protein EQV97_17685 [Pseudomonas sp. TMW22090]|nr:hypothetical protein [Pseudomonas sp. TMW22090]
MHQWCSIRRITCQLPSPGWWTSARVDHRRAGVATKAETPRGVRFYALSLATIASKLAPART